MLYAGEKMKIVAGAAVLYGLALIWVAVNQRKLMYHPETRLYTSTYAYGRRKKNSNWYLQSTWLQ